MEGGDNFEGAWMLRETTKKTEIKIKEVDYD